VRSEKKFGSLEIGSSLRDLEIVGVLRVGGMGKVYKVRNVKSNLLSAMKMLIPIPAEDQEVNDRFLREITLQARLKHPNIAGFHTAMRVNGQLVMLIEFVEGITLAQKLKAGPVSVEEALRFMLDVLTAIAYAHQMGVVHRDIKPSNIMITSEGIIKLIDFGLAKAANDSKLTPTGTVMGTPQYMSPEQIRGGDADQRTDIYSAGVSLYELVTGRCPFEGQAPAVISGHLERTPVPPININPKLSRALNKIILKSMAKEPSARFQTSSEFREALIGVQQMWAHAIVTSTAMRTASLVRHLSIAATITDWPS
jgi:serine/threonine protein kinase